MSPGLQIALSAFNEGYETRLVFVAAIMTLIGGFGLGAFVGVKYGVKYGVTAFWKIYKPLNRHEDFGLFFAFGTQYPESWYSIPRILVLNTPNSLVELSTADRYSIPRSGLTMLLNTPKLFEWYLIPRMLTLTLRR